MEDERIFVGGNDRTLEPGEKTLEVRLNGESFTALHNKDESIIECLLGAGFNPPYSCLDGACMACMARIEEGTITQEKPGILTEDNIKDREALTCQARPVSKTVKINYDLF
jgi:ferredoxin